MIRRPADMAGVVLLGVGYAVLAKIALVLFSSNGAISIVWPSSGLALAAVLLGGRRYLPGIFLGAVAGNMMAGTPALASGFIACGNMIEALLGSSLLGRVRDFKTDLTSPRDFLYLGATALACSAVGAAIGVATLAALGRTAWSDAPTDFLLWCQGDSLGIVLVTPLALVWRTLPRGWLAPGRRMEIVACFGTAFLAGQVIFLGWFHTAFSEHGSAPLMFAFVAWAAIRYGRQGALLVIGMTALQALLGARYGMGVFAAEPLQTALLHYWVYMMVLTVVGVELALTVERERHSAQEALSRSHGMLHKLSTRVPGVIYQFKRYPDGRTCFPFASEAIRDIFEVTPEQVLEDATPVYERVHPDDFARIMDSIAVSTRTLTTWRQEFRVVLPRQGVRWRMGESEPESQEDGSILWHGFISDITDRKHTEATLADYRDNLEEVLLTRTAELQQVKQVKEQLARSERKYRELVENANSIIFRWNSDGIITFMNEYGQKFFGWTEAELVGRHLMDTIVPPTESGGRDLKQMIGRITADPKAYELNINENILRDGRRVWISWTNKIVQDADGRMVEILSIGTDITERRETEREVSRLHADLQRYAEQLEERVKERTRELAEAMNKAEAADRIKSAFLATMSHELRTPLNSILGFTGIILQGLAGPLNPEQTKQLTMVQASARHLLTLINDVLDISKIEAGELVITAQPFNLRDSVLKAAASLRPLAEKKGLGMTVEIGETVGEMTGDSRRVEQILLNLLGNAIKFTDHGSVSLLAERTDDYTRPSETAPCEAVRLRIADTGIGIKPEDMELLFQPFRQVDSSLSRSHEGTGLGLAICQRLVAKMGGSIKAESRWREGSVFTVTLPLRLAAGHGPS